jgi:hypothetical protein
MPVERYRRAGVMQRRARRPRRTDVLVGAFALALIGACRASPEPERLERSIGSLPMNAYRWNGVEIREIERGTRTSIIEFSMVRPENQFGGACGIAMFMMGCYADMAKQRGTTHVVVSRQSENVAPTRILSDSGIQIRYVDRCVARFYSGMDLSDLDALGGDGDPLVLSVAAAEDMAGRPIEQAVEEWRFDPGAR